MKILALEFSSPRRTAAVIDSLAPERSTAGASFVPRPSAIRGTPAIYALDLIESALREAGLEREQIECLAVGLGPGSYTGIRAGIALAQGWQLASGVRLLGISTADCLAAEAQAAGLRGNVGVVIDAQRNEFYLATYEITDNARRETEALRLAPFPQVQAAAQAGQLLIGPEVEKWFPGGRVLFPGAATLARLAVARTDFIPGERLEPIYLRETAFVKAPPPRRIL
jgi:tRNA threonylcarbamoyl adenosine modification protein YeaZ